MKQLILVDRERYEKMLDKLSETEKELEEVKKKCEDYKFSRMFIFISAMLAWTIIFLIQLKII